MFITNTTMCYLFAIGSRALSHTREKVFFEKLYKRDAHGLRNAEICKTYSMAFI